jgi:hypothetical protein
VLLLHGVQKNAIRARNNQKQNIVAFNTFQKAGLSSFLEVSNRFEIIHFDSKKNLAFSFALFAQSSNCSIALLEQR